ncbi:MAG: WD40 repeat domain-containing protein, partial [Gemmataceae bacterium]
MARPVRRWEKFTKLIQRNPGSAALLAIIAFTLVGFTVASILVADQFRIMANDQADLADKEKTSRLAAEETRDASRRDLYHAETTLAMRLLGAPGSMERVTAHMRRWNETPDSAELFGWEWHLAQNLTRPTLTSQAIPRGADAIAIAPDGQTIAVGGPAGLTLLDAKTLEVRNEWNMPAPIKQLQWDLKGERLAISYDLQVALWDRRTEKTIWKRPAFNNPRMVFSPDGATVAYADRRHSCVIADGATGEPLRTFDKVDEVFGFSPDGKHFAVTLITPQQLHELQIWRTADWSSERIIPLTADYDFALAWAPDSRRIAIGTAIGQVMIFDPSNGRQLSSFDANGWACWDLAWRDDGQRLVAYHANGTIRTWDGPTWDEVPFCRGTYPITASLAWPPGGRELLAGGKDGSLRRWQIAQHPAYWTHSFGNRLANTSYLSCAWHPDSQRLAGSAASPGTIIWATNGDRQFSVNGVQWRWSNDGQHSATAFMEFIMVGDAQGRLLNKVELPGQPKVLAWQPNKPILGIRTANRIYLWNPLTEPAPQQIWGEPAKGGFDFYEANRFAWSPDGTRIAFSTKSAAKAASWNVSIMTVADRKIVQSIAEAPTPILTVAWSPDGTQ